MDITVEIKDGLKRRMTIALPVQKVSEIMNKEFQELRKRKMQVRGSRPGNLNAIKKHYGKSVQQKAIGDVINQVLPDAFQQESLEPAGYPTVESFTYKPEHSTLFEFTVLFEVYPQLPTVDFSAVELLIPVSELTDSDEDNALKQMQKQASEWNVVDRPAQRDDRLTVNYEATLEGEKLAQSRREDTPITLSENDNTLGFEQSLIGMKAGDEKDCPVSVGDEVNDEKLRGKTIHYHVLVKEVSEPKLPELDDKFAEYFDVKEGGIDALKTKLKASMQAQLDEAVQHETKDRVINKLLELHSDLSIPDALVQEEVERLRKQMLSRLQQYTKGEESIELPGQMFELEAKRRVTIGLLLNEYVRHHGLEPDQESVDAMINQQAANYPDPEQLKAYYHGNKEAMNAMRSTDLEEQVIKHLMEQATVKKEIMSYEQLVTDRNRSN